MKQAAALLCRPFFECRCAARYAVGTEYMHPGYFLSRFRRPSFLWRRFPPRGAVNRRDLRMAVAACVMRHVGTQAACNGREKSAYIRLNGGELGKM